jgi:hypothetical protein
MASTLQIDRELAFGEAGAWSSPLSIWGIVAFVAGATMPLVIRIGGELFIGELLLALVAATSLAATASGSIFRTRTLPRTLLALMMTLVGYVVSDFACGSAASDYLRGWSRIVFTGIDAVSLTWLALESPDNLRSYALGLALGQPLAAMLGLVQPRRDMWKFVYAYPVTISVATIFPWFGRFMTILAMGALGVFHMWLDYRSLGGFCVLTAALLSMNRRAITTRAQKRSALRLALALLVAGGLLAGVYVVSNESFAQRRFASNMARLIQLEIVAAAISRSPVIGYGSWAANSDVAREILAVGKAAGLPETYQEDPDPSKIGAHSQVLQSWYEGGVLGSVFFVYFIVQILKCLTLMALHAPWTKLNALFYLVLIWSLWAALLSPFAGEERHSIGLAVAVLCVCEKWRQEWLEPGNAEHGTAV